MPTDPREVLHRPAPPPMGTWSYGPSDNHVVETYAASGVPRGTTVALVHGGFWRREFDRTHLRPLAVGLTEAGFDVASLEYPRPGMPAGGWPGTVEAVREGLTAVAQGQVGRAVVVLGHSAGGHLAVLAGSGDNPAPVAGVVSLAGVLDLLAAHRMFLDNGAARDFLGTEPGATPHAWRAADPTQQRNRVPVHVLHGTKDRHVPLSLSLNWVRSRTPQDAPVAVTSLEGVEHFGLIDPISPAFSALVSAIEGIASGPSSLAETRMPLR